MIDEDAPPTVTAHRGSSADAPENTLAAIRLAMEQGADICELDVQQAGDGTLVVAHDANLERVTGVDRNVWEATAAQLAALEAGAFFDERFRGEPLPTLEQVVETVRAGMRLNLELKTHGHERGFVEAVVEAIRRHGLAESCLVTSTDVDVLRSVRAIAPGLRLGAVLVVTEGDEHDLDVDLYSVEQSAATAAYVERAHGMGREVHAWTANTRPELERLAAHGVDSVITDHPLLARELFDARRVG